VLILKNNSIFLIFCIELEALGDELALDTDTSYLEDMSTPKVPTREPGAESVNSVSDLLIATIGVKLIQLYV